MFQSFELLPQMNALKNVEMPLLYAPGTGGSAGGQGKKVARAGRSWRQGKAQAQSAFGRRKAAVAIARALVCKPSILLADEPTGNLDSKTSESILGLFD